jgi:hypothetical protein
VSDPDEREERWHPEPHAYECECGRELTEHNPPELCDCGVSRCRKCTRVCAQCGREGCFACMAQNDNGEWVCDGRFRRECQDSAIQRVTVTRCEPEPDLVAAQLKTLNFALRSIYGHGPRRTG